MVVGRGRQWWQLGLAYWRKFTFNLTCWHRLARAGFAGCTNGRQVFFVLAWNTIEPAIQPADRKLETFWRFGFVTRRSCGKLVRKHDESFVRMTALKRSRGYANGWPACQPRDDVGLAPADGARPQLDGGDEVADLHEAIDRSTAEADQFLDFRQAENPTSGLTRWQPNDAIVLSH